MYHIPHSCQWLGNGRWGDPDLTEHLSFCAGNFVVRLPWGRKDPDKHVEDLEKARWYIDREIEESQDNDALSSTKNLAGYYQTRAGQS